MIRRIITIAVVAPTLQIAAAIRAVEENTEAVSRNFQYSASKEISRSANPTNANL
jgi:hypothetical protein